MNKAPLCVGIIADGNRRFAQKRGISREAGHFLGYQKFKEVALWAKEAGVTHVIAYAFSTENWNRSPDEISDLTALFHFGLSPEEISFFEKQKVRMSIIGERNRFGEEVAAKIQEAEEKTRTFTDLHFVFAISYGGRADILQAVKRVAVSLSWDEVSRLSEESFSKYLWTGGELSVPDPALIIRTGGARRISNFLPWQSAYSELFFTDTFWPEFSREEFFSTLDEFLKRQRRFGK